MIERVAAGTRGLECDQQLLLDPLLPDEVVERARSQRALRFVLLRTERGREELTAHAAAPAPLSASFTRSSGDSSGSISARARSRRRTE